MKTRAVIIVGIIVAGFSLIITGTILIDFPIKMNPTYDLPENDVYCNTQILVQTTHKIDREVFAKTVLNEIKKLDWRFDWSDRYILITDMQNEKLRISIEGLWSPESSGMRLIESLEQLDEVESVLEDRGVRLALECQ
ncbi:hypothetical protein C6990_09540 [Nitrosopumilus sp. b3]|uniref:hypothetical protein n=1 Tax=Nitrosopumilus sp. b3 TaxID=2109909 RepID=UPI0015F4ACBC|nr:hypothetical protein [Nitrosopumilus sp. b3]KAF6246360.1 hypothetical protein C6990_09540 [Nitrosopumilus sp. b3]